MPPSQVTVAVSGSTATFSNSRTSRQSWKAPISRRLPRNTLPSSPSSKRSHKLESCSALLAVVICISSPSSCMLLPLVIIFRFTRCAKTSLFPIQRAAGLVLDDARLEEIALLLQIDHLAHPWKRVLRAGIQHLDADLLAAAVGDEAQVFLEHRRVEAEHAARHRVLRIAVLELHRAPEELLDLLAEGGRPEVRVLELDGVDEVDAEVAVHGLVAQDVHVLLCSTGHLVLPPERQDLGEADVEEQALHQAGEHDQALQQVLVALLRAGLERRVGQDVDERHQELVLLADRRDLVIGLEDLRLRQGQ